MNKKSDNFLLFFVLVSILRCLVRCLWHLNDVESGCFTCSESRYLILGRNALSVCVCVNVSISAFRVDFLSVVQHVPRRNSQRRRRKRAFSVGRQAQLSSSR